jgi:hypothetical protein
MVSSSPDLFRETWKKEDVHISQVEGGKMTPTNIEIPRLEPPEQ